MYTVLYVDDEPDLLEISKLFLESSGQFSVDTITSAPAALDLLKTKDYDAVISDYQMPGMDGIEFLKMVRTSGNTVPFILFTGRGREEVVIQALNEGADFYLQKGGEPKSQFAELAHQLRQVVQQRKAETSIRDLERREADIINFLPDATLAIDRAGHIIAWNRAIEEMTGVPVADMLGKGDYEYAIPFYGKRQPILIDLIFEPDEVIARKYAHIIHKKDTLIADTTLPILRGKPVTLMGTASPLYDRRGKVVGAIESIRDITERQQAEDAVKESEEKYRQSEQFIREVITGAKEGFIVYDRDLRYVIWNRFMENLSGVPAADLLGKKATDVFPHLKEFGIDLLLQRALSGETVESPDNQPVINYVGKKIWIKGIYSPHYDVKGHIIGVVGIVRDITKRKELEFSLMASEERYRNVVEDQTEFICRFLPDGTHVFVNEAYCRYFGLKRDEILGHRFRAVVPAEDRVRVEQFFASLTPDHPVDTIEHRIIMPDGSVRWQRWSDRAIFAPSGTVTEYQSVGRDITDNKATEAALREANKKLKLLSSITRHDINNQLVVVQGYAKLAALEEPASVIAEFLAKIESAVRTIHHQIEFTRTYQDLGMQAPAWFRVCKVIRSIRLQEIALDCTCDPCEIFADPMIVKVFFNLFDNVVKHGGGATTVTAGCKQAGDGLVITFADNGVGIPDDQKQKIFEKGYGRNTGFGLFLAREILAITGISIRETGTHGNGARFEITVPKGAYLFP